MATNWLRSKVKLRVIQCEGVALDLLPRVLVLVLLLVVVVVVCLLLRVLVAVCHLTSVAVVTVASLRVAAAVVVLAAALKVEQVKMRFESSALHMWRDY